MLLTRSNAVLSHQVANYGMGGQYEPHFDFSRVRPKPWVFPEGPIPADLRKLEILGAFQPLYQLLPPMPYQDQLFVPGKVQLRKHGACGAPCSLAVSPRHDCKASDLTRSL